MAKKATVKTADFSTVKERGNFNPKHVAEGDWAAVITKVEDGESKKNQNFQYVFTIKLTKFSQYSYPYYCQLQENQLWKLRNLAVAAGLNVPKKRMKFDPNKLVGKKIGVTMEDDEYEGKMKSVISATFPISELTEGVEIEGDDNFDEGADDGPQLAGGDDEFDPEDEAGTDDEKPKKKKDKGKKKGKKKKKDEDVEELDVSDV